MKVSIGPYPEYNKKTKKTPARKISIKLDGYDTWNCYETIGLLVTPLLKQLLKTKHGAPWTDDFDVPQKLRSTNDKRKRKAHDLDKFFFKRWEWILSEMIWAFEQMSLDVDDKKFHSGKSDIRWKKLPSGGYRMLTGPKDTHKFDRKGYQAHLDRIENGLSLFAKYALSLWD